MRFQTAGELLNRVAVGVGLESTSDPFASADHAYIQLRMLANECGQDLIMVDGCPWQQLERDASFTTASGDSGDYDLPADFAYMIDQTGWQQGVPAAAYPLLGPASAQYWSYLEASQSLSLTLYAWFRLAQGQLKLWPQPPPVGIPIAYRYLSRYWVLDGASPPPPAPQIYKEALTATADVVLFEPILFLKKLKLAFLQAKGFDTTKAEDEFQLALESCKGKDKSAPILCLNGPVGFTPPLLNLYTNVPETGVGL